MKLEQALGFLFFGLTLTAYAVLSSFTLVPLFLVRYLEPYEAAKAVTV